MLNSNFRYNNNIFCIDNKPILDFNKKSPVHFYSSNYIADQYAFFNNGIKTKDKLICYAMKANFNIEILKILVNLGAGMDCVSIGEIKQALLAGCDPKKIVFSGVGKTTEELILAIKLNIKQISCESLEELDEIVELSKKLKINANICLRVNLDIEVATHKYIATGAKSAKFGIEANKIILLCKKIEPIKHINFIGLSIHIGSQIIDYKNFENAFNSFIKVIKSVQLAGHKIKSISLGGGLGVAYKPEEIAIAKITAQKYLDTVNDFEKQVQLPIIIEPGRFLMANAGVTLAKVIRVKKTQDIEFLILNVGMNNIIRPALYQAYHHILPAINNPNSQKKIYKIVGPICESADIFHENYFMQVMQKNDYVVILSTGAYCSSMASNYNLMKIAKEVII